MQHCMLAQTVDMINVERDLQDCSRVLDTFANRGWRVHSWNLYQIHNPSRVLSAQCKFVFLLVRGDGAEVDGDLVETMNEIPGLIDNVGGPTVRGVKPLVTIHPDPVPPHRRIIED